MRNPLNKRIPRELKTNAAKYIGMALILICTIMVGSSFLVTLESVEYTLNETETSGKIEDGQFECSTPLPDKILDTLSKKDMTITKNFYSSDNEYDNNTKVIIFDERKTLNLPSIFEGSLPTTDKEIAVDRIFAETHNLKVGDNISLNKVDFKISATIALPDYSSLFKSNQDLMMKTKEFGVAVVNEDGFARFNKDTLTYRYSYLLDNRNLTDKQKDEKAKEIQKELVKNNVLLKDFLTAKNNQCISFLKTDMGSDVPTMKAFIFLLIAIIAFVFAVLTNNTIEQEAAIIGTLRASGYLKREIISHYMKPTIIIAIVSSIIGNLLGYTAMIKPFEDMYYSTYSVPPIILRFSMEAFILTTIVPVVIMVVINYLMLRSKLSLSPLRFLRKDLHKGKQKKAIKLPNFSFMRRFHLRVILQNKLSYLLLFVGIFLSSFLLMFGIGMEPLLKHYEDEIDKTLTYEYQYILKAPIEVSGGEKLQVSNLKTWYPLGKNDINTTFMGIVKDSEYFHDVKLPEKDDEIVITEPFAKKLNLKVGDSIKFKDDYYDKDYTLKIADICKYNSTLGAFMDKDKLNKLLGKDSASFNAYVSNKKLDIEDAYTAKIISRKDLIGATSQMLDSFDGVIKAMNVFSVAIYMILMYILTKTVIEKNAIHISFMKVFGYNSKEINSLYLKATTITVLVSLFICIPIEALCFKYILIYCSSMIEGYLEYYLPVWVYIAIVVIGIVAYFAINALHVRKVKKIPMSDALKNRE